MCTDCLDGKNCLSCVPQTYLKQGKCRVCSDSWAGCTDCTFAGCLKCEDGYYIDGGKCKKCSDIEGCMPGQCTMEGCQKCEEGLYLSGKICKSCKAAIIGCVTCTNEKTCTSCSSNFLEVQDDVKGNKVCKCNGKSPNMLVDGFGSCTCANGYFLTAKGCQTCEEIIPGCEQCY